ncbi:hypothetical protein [Halobaculum sp. MBLA0143]|uniref:hypothetical protein n=1 Tax=Halobaculum sp. MBLA0143 TaxID=3079933 RepID=UPI0035253B66
MRELDCDFCGAAAAGAYEIGPAPPDRSPTDRRRLVLCDDCRATLSTAVEPLLERLRTAESGTTGVTDTGESGTTGVAGSDADESTEQSGLEPAGSTSEPTPDDPTDDEGDRDTGDSRRDGVDPRAANGSADAVGGERGERDGATGADDETGGPGASDDDTDETGGDDNTGRTDTSDRTEGSEEPPQFRKVMRLLNNRSFPVDRSEFVDLAAGAYDLEPEAVEESLVYAVERGVLGTEDGRLVRG